MRMWEIRENNDYRDSDYKHKKYGRGSKSYGMGHYGKDEVEEAYECGFEEGYEEAMRELGHSAHGRMRKY